MNEAEAAEVVPGDALGAAEVAKMIKVFGAPISEADARAIADYLKANYGSDHVTENR